VPLAGRIAKARFARALVFKKLTNTKENDYALHTGRQYGAIGMVIRDGRPRAFLNDLCASLGMSPLEIENCGYEWSARVQGAPSAKLSQSSPISKPFVNAVADAISAKSEICGLDRNYEVWKRNNRDLNQVFVVILLALAAGIVDDLIPGSPLSNYSNDAVVLAAVYGALIGVRAFSDTMRWPEMIAKAERETESFAVNQWFSAAPEVGNVKIALRERYYGLAKSPNRVVRDYCRKMGSFWDFYGRSFSRIDDITTVPAEESLRLIDNAVSSRHEMRGSRGFVFEATSTDPMLAGTYLQIIASLPIDDPPAQSSLKFLRLAPS